MNHAYWNRQGHISGAFRPRLLPTVAQAETILTAGPLIENLVGHWDLSEASGERADSTTNGRHMNVLGAGSVGSAAGVGVGQTAAVFTTAGGVQQLHTSPATSTDFGIGDEHFLVNFWMRHSAWSGADWYWYVSASAISPYSSGGGWLISRQADAWYRPKGGGIHLRSAADAVYKANEDGDYMQLDTWYMYTWYHNPTSNTINVMLNGVPVATFSLTGGAININSGLSIGYRNDARMQSVSVWKGANAASIWNDHMPWLYNSGTAARLYSDIFAYDGGASIGGPPEA